jgi:c-di-GMP-binding flagellar brake protein YcgR
MYVAHEPEKQRMALAYEEIDPGQQGHIFVYIFSEVRNPANSRRSRIHSQPGGRRQRKSSTQG